MLIIGLIMLMSFRPLTRISLLVTTNGGDLERKHSLRFQTVDTDFSPGDESGTRQGDVRWSRFQTVDTDFSPGDPLF